MGNISPVVQSMIFRECLMLLFACLLPAASFLKGYRSQLLQWFLFILGLFIGALFPINRLLALQPKPKGYLLLLALFGLVFLTLIIPFFICRAAGAEKKLKIGIAIVLLGLFVLNLLSLL